jgi:hypothetical protein
MERTDTNLLEVLFAHDPELGSPVAESLAALDQPEYTPRVVEVLAGWLERFPGDTNRTEAVSVTDSRGESSAPEIEPPQRSVFDAVARCSVSAPDESQVFWEPLSRLTAHEESRFRCGAYRCLGCLGAAGGMESGFVAKTVADGLADESPAVRRVALWSLTRLALTAPDAVAPFRGDVLTQLEATSSEGRETTDALTRRHAAEALVASATGGYAPERDRPERGFQPRSVRDRHRGTTRPDACSGKWWRRTAVRSRDGRVVSRRQRPDGRVRPRRTRRRGGPGRPRTTRVRHQFGGRSGHRRGASDDRATSEG